MKPKGILFKGEMIRALLNTQVGVWPPKPIDSTKPYKGQTRRTIEPQPDGYTIIIPAKYHPSFVDKTSGEIYPGPEVFGFANEEHGWVCPYPPGTILYAKETHHVGSNRAVSFRADYPVDGDPFNDDECGEDCSMVGEKWKPSIFMPMKAARLWFEVVKVRVERVNQISEDDALLEGIPIDIETIRRNNYKQASAYRELWDSINGAGDFAKGKWVWVYEIKRIEKP